MTDWFFTARERFGPFTGDSWKGYVEWIGFGHVEELVSLDGMLCRDLVGDLVQEDWDHNVHEDCRTSWFGDVDYLLGRIDWSTKRGQLLAMREEPTTEAEPPAGFLHCGYDILDGDDHVSVLVNCGHFPGVFEPTEVNRWGLLDDLARAREIAERIRADRPDDHHCADCHVWQVSRCLPANR